MDNNTRLKSLLVAAGLSLTVADAGAAEQAEYAGFSCGEQVDAESMLLPGNNGCVNGSC